MGSNSTESCGLAASQPRAIASAAAEALSVPLNLSGAMSRRSVTARENGLMDLGIFEREPVQKDWEQEE